LWRGTITFNYFDCQSALSDENVEEAGPHLNAMSMATASVCAPTLIGQ
jgi:hypothetical protein